MAKIDTVLEALEGGMSDPVITSGTSWVEDEKMEDLHVRRKKAGQPRHKLWYLSIGESGQQPATFWGHKISDCLKKALSWKGLPTSTRKKN